MPRRMRPPSVVVLVTAMLASACGGGAAPVAASPSAAATTAATSSPAPQPSTPRPLEKVNIRFSFRANGQYAPFYIALDKGFYKDEGIDMELNEGTGGSQVMQTLAAGKDFLVTPGLDILVTARSQGAPVKAVAVLQQDTPAGIGVLSSSSIQKPEDLAGKTIVTSAGATSNTLFVPFLKANGVNPDSVKLITVAGGQAVPTLLSRQGGAEGATIFQTDDYVLLQSGDAKARFLPYSDKLEMYGVGMVVAEDTLKSKPDLVRRVVRATIKGHQYAADHPDETIDSLFNHIQVPGTKAEHVARLKAHIAQFQKTQANGCLGCMTAARFQKMEDLIQQYGALTKKAPSATDYFTNDYVK